jgi:hypothetical protein
VAAVLQREIGSLVLGALRPPLLVDTHGIADDWLARAPVAMTRRMVNLRHPASHASEDTVALFCSQLVRAMEDGATAVVRDVTHTTQLHPLLASYLAAFEALPARLDYGEGNHPVSLHPSFQLLLHSSDAQPWFLWGEASVVMLDLSPAALVTVCLDMIVRMHCSPLADHRDSTEHNHASQSEQLCAMADQLLERVQHAMDVLDEDAPGEEVVVVHERLCDVADAVHQYDLEAKEAGMCCSSSLIGPVLTRV